MNIVNPANGQTIKTINEDTGDSLKKKFEAAKKAQVSWATVSVQDRVKCIEKFQQLLKRDIKELAHDLTLETGKPIRESRNEVNGACSKLQFFIDQSQKILHPQVVNEAGNTKEVLDYDALGVILNISAWNYPYLVGINIFIPALICGNAVLYKPSEHATLTGLHIHRLLLESGIPSDCFQVCIGGAEVGKQLLDLPINGYYFTGSYSTGTKIAEKMSNKMLPSILELGGKDPLYVRPDVNSIKDAAENAVEGAFYNNGQSCCSVERIYVHQDIYDQFISFFVAKVKSLRLGDPLLEDTDLGAVTRPQHLGFLQSLVADACEQGAELMCGGDVARLENTANGSFFQPTVLTRVTHSMRLMKEETFGPVIGIMRVRDDAEAVQLMNDTDYGLTVSIYTADQAQGQLLLKQINSGTGYINCCDRVSSYLPWAGRKNSGFGASLSKHGLYAFCHTKAYHIRG